MISYPLAVSLGAMLTAQVLKFLFSLVLDGKLDFSRLFSTGGMPSSHTALATALTTAFGIEYGVESPFFAMAFIMTIVIAHDAAGVRWQAGQHASEINKIREDLQNIYKILTGELVDKNRKHLKEILGHKPLEVFMGGLLGVIIAFIFK